MALPLPFQVSHNETQNNFDEIAQKFPLTPNNILGGIPTATATLPTGTYNGQDFFYQVSGGGVWHFKYNLTSAKWDFAGGPPLFSEVVTSESTISVAYAALATAGPSCALPFAGDYDIEIGCDVNANTAGITASMSYDIGGTGAVDADRLRHLEPSAGNTNAEAVARATRKTGLTAVTLTAKYKTGANTSFFANRWMRVSPVRVG